MLRLTTLGTLALMRDGTLLDDATAARRRLALLAVLSSAGAKGSVSRDRLFLLFWPDRTQAQARSALKQLTFAIRKSLGEEDLFIGTSDLRLNPAVITSDVGDILRAAETRDHQGVADTYRGVFLDGFHLGDAWEFEQWLENQRRVIDTLYSRARAALAEASEHRGDLASAAEHWAAVAALDPLDAAVAGRLVRAFAAAGNASAALRHVRNYETLAQRELGLGPDPTLRKLAQEIAAGGAALAREQIGPVSNGVEHRDAVRPAQNGTDRSAVPTIPAAAAQGAARRHSRVARLALPGALALLVIGGILVRQRRTVPIPTTPRVLVLPFENQTNDTSLGSLGAVAADWISKGLMEIGVVDLASLAPSDTRAADSAALSGAVGAHLGLFGEHAHATEAVLGRFYFVGDSIRIDAKAVVPSTNGIADQFGSVSAPRRDAARALETIRQRIMGRYALRLTGGFLAPSERAKIPPTYEAYRAYLQATNARSRSDYPEVYRNAMHAYRLDTTFLTPLIEATWAAYELHDCVRADSISQSLESRRQEMRLFDEQYIDRMIAWCRGDWPKAFALAQRMVELNPLLPEGPYMAGRSALNVAKPHIAISYFERVDAQRGTFGKPWEYYRDLAAAYHQIGDYHRELKVLERGLKANPGERSYQLYLIHPLVALGRTAELDSILNEVPTAKRNTDIAFISAIGELRHHGDTAHAMLVARRFAQWAAGVSQDSGEIAAGRAVLPLAWLLAGQTTAARAAYDGLATRYPRQWRYLTLAGVAAALCGDRARAAELSAAVARLDVANQLGAPAYGQAQIAAALGDRDAAVRLLQQAIHEGVPYDFAQVITPRIRDWDPLLHALDGYGPFERLLAPKG